MLVIEPPRRRLHAGDDSGAVLVTVVIVMLVGFVIAVTIAASVIFTMGANAGNKDRTQAFIAAESGRDAALANAMKVPCTVGATSASGSSPIYAATVTTGSPTGAQTASCPSLSTPSVINITSTGTGPDGSTTQIVSKYERAVTYVGQPGGVMAYFSGQFKATQSLYEGDLVIRDGLYLCNSTTTIDGDLWVPRGGVTLSADCDIDGNIYAEGDVNITSAKPHITGSIYARGSVTLSAANAIVDKDLFATGGVTVEAGTLSGSAHAGTNINVTGGEVGGDVYAKGNVAVGFNQGEVAGSAYAGGTATEKNAADVAGTLNSGSATPVADPGVPQSDLDAVFVMTTWVDLPLEPAFWGTDVKWETGPCDDKAVTSNDVTSLATQALASPYTRVGIDYRACSGPVMVNLGGGATNFTHDVVFLVAPGSVLKVTTGNINSTAPLPQLFFVQGDNILGNSVPNCGAGMASGELSLGTSLAAELMFYTPCGFKNTNGVAFDGQFYSNTDGSSHWVQPAFSCVEMEWLPMLDLGCQIDTSVTSGTTSTPILGPPTLISQTEQ